MALTVHELIDSYQVANLVRRRVANLDRRSVANLLR